MKKIPTLLAVALGSVLFGQIKFEENSFANLLKKAKTENKLIFMDAYASWCGPCKLMAKNIFTKPVVGDYYNANFINTKIDMEKGEGTALAKKYGVSAYPTYLFINGDGEVVYRGTGYYQENDFIGIGKEANNPAKQMSALLTKFNAGEKDPEFLKNFIKVYGKSDPKQAQLAVERYLEGKKGQTLNQEELGMLLQFVGNSSSPLYQEFVSRKAEFLKLMPEAKYNAILTSFQLETILKKAYNKDTKVLDEALFIAEAKKIAPEEKVMTVLKKLKMNLALQNKDYKAYQNSAIEYYGDGTSEKLSAEELNAVAWTFFRKVEDKDALQKAIKWAEQSVKKNEMYANTDTLANLYLKIGDKKNAKIWAEKSLELAKKSGEDASSTQEILNKVK